MSQQEKDTRQGQDTTLSGKQEGTTTLQNRRRLLKAAGMAPVIYTLPAGAQVAAGSSCIDKPGNAPQTASRNGVNVTLDGETERFCQLDAPKDGGTCTVGDKEYVYDDGQLFNGSCWASLNPP